VWLRPPAGTTLDVALRHAADPEDALAKAFVLGSPADIDTVWVDGRPCRTGYPVA
jgi:guanine deaminase